MIRNEQNKQLYVRLANEILTGKNLSIADELFAADFTENAGGEKRVVGIEGFKVARRRRNLAFPDWRVVIEDMVAEDGKVVVRATGHGTHRGEFIGLAPTGRNVRVSWIASYRVADGKFAEHWQNIDDLGLLKQLGASVSLPTLPLSGIRFLHNRPRLHQQRRLTSAYGC